MGVDCRITFPNNVRLRDVANAIGILAGLNPVQKHISGALDSFFVDVPGVTTKSYNSLGLECCAQIDLTAPEGETLVDGKDTHYTMYHFEYESPTADPDIKMYSSGISPRSTPFWIAIGKRLVETFGGSILCNDCGDNEKPDRVVGAHWLNGATNGEKWNQNQRRIFELSPVSKAEMDEARKVAAYK